MRCLNLSFVGQVTAFYLLRTTEWTAHGIGLKYLRRGSLYTVVACSFQFIRSALAIATNNVECDCVVL